MSPTDTFTSTGSKFFAHQEAMTKLRNGRGQPITCHIMLTDICQHTCAFCSVQARAGDSLRFEEVVGFVDILLKYGLKSVILSGGGNPLLYRCRETGSTIDNVVMELHRKGLEIGLITNGMPTANYISMEEDGRKTRRMSWKSMFPEVLDMLKWVRISMSGLDHKEVNVYVPDIDPSKTTLGFSYVAHDIWMEPADRYHGKVSRPLDLIGRKHSDPSDYPFEARIPILIRQMQEYVRGYRPRYLRLLPNCLEPEKIPQRCEQLGYMADHINQDAGREVAFVQYKPPAPPRACYLGYVHPVLNCDGYVYPCDSCVLNEAAGHSFSNSWRVCHWRDVASIYEAPIRSLIEDPSALCPGCVFTKSNELLADVRNGVVVPQAPGNIPEHVNFI